MVEYKPTEFLKSYKNTSDESLKIKTKPSYYDGQV